MKKNEVILRKQNSKIASRLSLVTVMIVIFGLGLTTIISVAQADTTAQDVSSLLDGSALAPINNQVGQQTIHENHAPVCPGPAGKDSARCHAQVITDAQGKPQASTVPAGYGPVQFQTAYGLSVITSNATIAIVDAYDHPNIKKDLDAYNTKFNLPFFPLCSNIITTGCFQKVDQNGGIIYPQTNSGWALEIALDVEVAHAVCPKCKILLVEANSNSFTNLLAAENTAGSSGATVISNSWGAAEFSSETSSSYDGNFNKPGISITFSSGDSGYGVEYPAASQYVTAVGGTTLNAATNSEIAWSGAGSGCSAFETKPTFQTDSGCSRRTVADVAADADPNTGAAVYDSVRIQGRQGWFKVGGTSLASPIIAGVYALAGGVGAGIQGNSVPYSHVTYLHDITSGSNGACGGSYLCMAQIGYDGPTGLGTPNGTGGFTS
jgi:subtilase family serine protease